MPISPRSEKIADSGAQVRIEQDHLDAAFECLEHELVTADTELRATNADHSVTTPQGRSERDAKAKHHQQRLAKLGSVSGQLCFGRLDFTDAEAIHIGRIGLSDHDRNTILVDWRAEAASAFYRATPLEPLGVTRRRHITTRNRNVISIDDDLLDNDLSADQRSTLVGEAALLAALNEHRTGRMGNIVATIQSEQDQIIRAPLRGTLVVQGGPGTGKTVVALHRAAYLLYEHRGTLSTNGVLVVGPNARFMRYIENVISELGEGSVVRAALGEMHIGVRTDVHDAPVPAAVKGSKAMCLVLADAIRAQQRLPSADFTLRLGGFTTSLTRPTVVSARASARDSRRPHNEAGAIFRKNVRRLIAREINRKVPDEIDRENAIAALRTSSLLNAAMDVLWPTMTAEQLVTSMYCDAKVHRLATRHHLPDDQAATLVRTSSEQWTVEDVAVLDEARTQLGVSERKTSVPNAAVLDDQQIRRDEAQHAADSTGTGWAIDGDTLLERYDEPLALDSLRDMAVVDANWTYSHVMVDEAQELSNMQWRMIAKRCPTRSMTIVGDMAQASSPGAGRSWSDALTPHFPKGWELVQLTVNYRTPAEVEPIATAVLSAGGIDVVHPHAVRSTGIEPEQILVDRDEVEATLEKLVRDHLAANEGTVAVISASGAGPGVQWLDTVASADRANVSIIDAAAAKGLEFDTVIVVDPPAILDSPSGFADLYVAVTRTTRRLVVLTDRPLSDVLEARSERATAPR